MRLRHGEWEYDRNRAEYRLPYILENGERTHTAPMVLKDEDIIRIRSSTAEAIEFVAERLFEVIVTLAMLADVPAHTILPPSEPMPFFKDL